ncbi:DUF1801 domain-containing protein [Enterococcus sp. HY326]|uniref:DUF1801 domain-containing protein n=1 Tax=Enterococcus sp. HY326 TaxID=2971265 RepID=UPI0022402883|nr:DUF1801 domain-containing protein [Enterococcus sp. HY326]
MLDVQEFYPNYSESIVDKLSELQKLIWSIATEQQINLTELPKWGQLSIAAKNGTPIRIDKFSDNEIALFVHCQTNLLEKWRGLFSNKLTFSGNRGIILDINSPLPENELKMCIDMALNYHSL